MLGHTPVASYLSVIGRNSLSISLLMAILMAGVILKSNKTVIHCHGGGHTHTHTHTNK